MRVPKDLIQKLADSSSFLAHIHKSPDPDSIGSTLALKLALESEGKVVELFCEDELPSSATFLPEVESVKQMPLTQALSSYKHDAYLALDTPILGLLTSITPAPEFKKPVLIIDHHPDTAIRGQISWRETSASSTSEMVYHLIKKTKIEITPQIATCLMFGLLGDTGSFQNYNTNQSSLTTAAALLEAGADYNACLLQLNRSYNFNELRSWAVFLDHLRLSDTGDFAWVVINNDVWQKLDPATSIRTFADFFIGRVATTKFGAVLIENRPGQVKGALRSRFPEVDVEQIASRLSGGGHKNASGFRFLGSLQDAERQFLNAVHSLKQQKKL